MIDKKTYDLLNVQFNKELYSSSLYRNMSALVASWGMPGFSHWLNCHSEEELLHAKAFYDYMLSQDVIPIVTAMPYPEVKAKDYLTITMEAKEFEIKTTQDIHEIVDYSHKSKDYATMEFLQMFVREQVEEVDLFNELEDKFKLAKNGGGIYVLDNELGKRDKETKIG